MSFQENLVKYRKRLNITAKEFAAKIDIPYTKYIAYENKGVEPKYDTLCKIAAALYIPSINDLLDYEPDKIAYFKIQIRDAGYTIEEENSYISIADKDKTFAVTYGKNEFIQIMEDINYKAIDAISSAKEETLRLLMFETFCRAYISTQNGNVQPITANNDTKKNPTAYDMLPIR